MRREDGESGVGGVATVGGKDSVGRDPVGEKVMGIVIAVKVARRVLCDSTVVCIMLCTTKFSETCLVVLSSVIFVTLPKVFPLAHAHILARVLPE